jgi:hypothetical protein
MSGITTLSDELFNQRKSDALNAEAKFKTIPMYDLELIDTQHVIFEGRKVSLTSEALKGLFKVLNIPEKIVQRFASVTSEEGMAKFVNLLKNGMVNSQDLSITLVANSAGVIVGINSAGKGVITNESFFDVVERLASGHSLNTVDFSVNDSTGGVAINMIGGNGSLFGISGLSDEKFMSGITFLNSPSRGMHLKSYVNRLSCANGITTTGFNEDIPLPTMGGGELEKFYGQVDMLAKNGFQPNGFTEAVKRAIGTKASYAELEKITSALKSSAGKDLDIYSLNKWIPLAEVQDQYKRSGINLEDMNHAQKKNASTGTTVWQAINGMTHFATHENGFDVKGYDRRKLQKAAGDILSKNSYDMENQIVTPYDNMSIEEIKAENAF